MRIGALAALSLAILTGLASPAAAQVSDISREAAARYDYSRPPFASVGTLTSVLGSSTGIEGAWRVMRVEMGNCSGVLLSMSQILVPAHCLDSGDRGYLPASEFVFTAGPPGAPQQRRLASYRTSSRFIPGAAPQAATEQNDWAVVTLVSQLDPPLTPMPQFRDWRPRGGDRLTILRHWGAPGEEARQGEDGCRMIDMPGLPDALIFHDCPIQEGWSGSPVILRRSDGSWGMVAMNVAIRDGFSRSLSGESLPQLSVAVHLGSIAAAAAEGR